MFFQVFKVCEERCRLGYVLWWTIRQVRRQVRFRGKGRGFWRIGRTEKEDEDEQQPVVGCGSTLFLCGLYMSLFGGKKFSSGRR